MFDTNPLAAPERGVAGPSPGRFRRLLRRLGDRVFAGSDSAARERGWQVTRSPSGLRRTYRDPRFDRLAACAGPTGHIGTPGTVCARCGARFFRETP